MGFGSIDTSELRRLQQKLNRITEQEVDRYIESCAKELAARLLAAVIPKTPVGDYSNEVIPSGKIGGSLRRGWIARTEGEASGGEPSAQEIDAHVESLEVRHEGNTFKIEVRNCMNYASYVEKGHRQTPGRYVPQIGKCLKVSWVEGKHMLETSEQEINGMMPQMLEQKITNWLRECMND